MADSAFRSAASRSKLFLLRAKEKAFPPDPQEILATYESGDAGQAQARRLRSVLRQFDVDSSGDTLGNAQSDAVAALTERADRKLLWLVAIAVLGRCPDSDELNVMTSTLSSVGSRGLIDQLRLESAMGEQTWANVAELEFVSGVLVDASTTASRDVHTGIQRVVREVVPRWCAAHSAQLIVFDRNAKVWRHPTKQESARVLSWRSGSRKSDTQDESHTIVVPWNATVLIPELAGEVSRSAATVVAFEIGLVAVAAVVHDLLPLTNPEMYNPGMPAYFARYMEVLRRAARVVTVSQTVAGEVREVFSAGSAEGCVVPDVKAVLLPVEAVAVDAETVETSRPAIDDGSGLPIVLAVSSLVPRKNNVRLLAAANRLWDEGLAFQLVIIAGFDRSAEEFLAEYERTREAGRPVVLVPEASEEVLWSAYRLARFTVFVSLLEGYGLPAAESIAAGTPVVLSSVGSMAEVGAAGGAEFVDPHDVGDIARGMRVLLTDDSRLDELATHARALTHTTWDDYAGDTWKWLVGGE